MKTVKKTKLSRLADEYREACVNADDTRQRGYKRWVKTRHALLAWAESERRR